MISRVSQKVAVSVVYVAATLVKRLDTLEQNVSVQDDQESQERMAKIKLDRQEVSALSEDGRSARPPLARVRGRRLSGMMTKGVIPA